MAKFSQKSSISNFGRFLDTAQASEKNMVGDRETGHREKENKNLTGHVAIDLLNLLSDGESPVIDLMASSRIGMLEFAEKLKGLQTAELVEIVRSPQGAEQVRLTKMGEKLRMIY
jgi:hypothetical protein